MVGPLVAANGLPFGKMSGRGLGFTGGTLDKLESIEGWSCDLTNQEFYAQLRSIGLVICGQTANLAPADRILYALRNDTATVESLPLTVSSIMSKKIVGGAQAILLDVKTGSGTFCRTPAAARTLGQAMVAVGRLLGRQMEAWSTQMNQPLGCKVGNSLEVQEAVATLQGHGPADFTELATRMAGRLLVMGGQATSMEDGLQQVGNAIREGHALACLRTFVEAQGGNPACIDQPECLPQAPVQMVFAASEPGWIQQMHTDQIGRIALALGAGRVRKGDDIDPAVGLDFHCKTGARVETGDPICTIHARTDRTAEDARQALAAAIRIGPHQTEALAVILERIGDGSGS